MRSKGCVQPETKLITLSKLMLSRHRLMLRNLRARRGVKKRQGASMDIVSWLLIIGIAVATNIAMLLVAGAFRRKPRRNVMCDKCGRE